MATKPKTAPESWADKLQVEEVDAPAEHEDPLLQAIASKMSRPPEHVIQLMVLRRELHLAKAKILELELKALGVATES